MDIVTYRKEKGLSQAAFAALLTGTGAAATQGLVSQWENRTTAIRAERAIQIELATGEWFPATTCFLTYLARRPLCLLEQIRLLPGSGRLLTAG